MTPAAILMGGAPLIQQAVAIRLAKHGLTIAVLGSDSVTLQETVDAVATNGLSPVPVAMQCPDHQSVRDALQSIRKRCGRIATFVIGLDQQSLVGGALGLDGLATVMRATEEGASQLESQGSGQIVYMLTSTGRYRSGYFKIGASRLSEQAAVEGALLAQMRQLALELAPRGVRANAVAAGLIEGAIGEAEWLVTTDNDREAILEEISVGRRGTPDEVAAVVEFLALGSSSYITGATIDVNGGWWMS